MDKEAELHMHARDAETRQDTLMDSCHRRPLLLKEIVMVLPIARSIPEDTLGDRRRRALGRRMQLEVAHQACVVAWP